MDEDNDQNDFGEIGIKSEERVEVGEDATEQGSILNGVGSEEQLLLKRKTCDKNHWKRNLCKSQREKGQAYNGRSKKSDRIEARSIGPRCSCSKGSYQCKEFTDEERNRVFEYVWSLTWEQKKSFVSSLIQSSDIARRTVIGSDKFRKQVSFVYFLETEDGRRFKVCRAFFLSTTGLRRWSVREWCINADQTDRLTVATPTSSRFDGQRDFSVEFLKALPQLPSHYSKTNFTKHLLEPVFQTFADVYKLYTSKCEEFEQIPLCRQTVKCLFDELHLSLFHPEKDMCDICTGYTSGSVKEEVWLSHCQHYSQAQSAMVLDSEMAVRLMHRDGENVLVCCMDLQAVQMIPQLKKSYLYYKSKLCVHHFTVCNLATNDVASYVWHEGEGGLTANEFATCIVDYLEQNPGYSRYILYSDGSAHQNLNVTLSKALLHFSIMKDVEIEQKFLEKGHAQMEVHSVHACVKRNLKNASLYVPAQYVERIESACDTLCPYHVNYVQHEFFKDFTQVCNVDFILPGGESGAPPLSDMRCLRYSPDGTISFKLGHDNLDYQPLALGLKSREIIIHDPIPLHLCPRKLDKKKIIHLLSLKPLMPIDYHGFYDRFSM